MRETERRERDRQGRREGDSNTQSETETGRLRKTVREYKGHRSSVYIYIWLSSKRHACKGLCNTVENKTLLKTVFIWNVVLCTCMNEWIYSTDNFSNQAVVDFKIQSSHTEKSAEKWPPKMDIHVPSDFRLFAYKQIASTWSNNHWFGRGKHRFIRII